jgi:HSP20 family protein
MRDNRIPQKGDPDMAEHTVVPTPTGRSRAEGARNGKFFTPRVDIYETENELLLYADLPGANPQDIDLRYERGELVLRAKATPPAVKGQPVLEEFETGDFFRVFQIHETINANKIDADYKDGVLIVHLPKQEQVKPKQVKVRTS